MRPPRETEHGCTSWARSGPGFPIRLAWVGNYTPGRRFAVEERLAAIITEVLRVPRLSVDDDFFHLGAHSLLGAQIIARVREVFGTELRLLDVFDAPTVAELSVKIEQALTLQLNAMTEAEVEAALAALDEPLAAQTDNG